MVVVFRFYLYLCPSKVIIHMAEISIIIVLLAGLVYGIFLVAKPSTKPVNPVAIQEDEDEVKMAEEYNVVNEAEDGTDPRDGAELSVFEATMIDAEEDAMDELKKGEEHLTLLRELGYKVGAQENAPEVAKKEDVVLDTEEDGRKFYPANEQGRHDPFEYQPHNI